MAQQEYDLGDQIGPFEFVISEEKVAEFISISALPKSLNRFTSAKLARDQKFPESIVPGNMHLTILSDFLTTHVNNIVIRKIDMIFRHIVKQNIQLIIKGFVTNISFQDNNLDYECDITIQDQQGISLVIANAKFTIEKTK